MCKNQSSFYSNLGAKAGELPASKRVFTEEEVQLAISRALMAYGVFSYIEAEGSIECQHRFNISHIHRKTISRFALQKTAGMMGLSPVLSVF